PHITVKDCSHLFWNLRKIKSPAEIDLLRKAGQIGVKAHIAVMKATRPGTSEQELAALFEYVCKKEMAQELAFYVILMSGPNHAFGHYHKHDRILKNGDFIILDAGPEYGYYNADISSTFPANGKFSSKQKKIYEMAYGIRKTCLDNYRPGITFKDVGEKVKQFLIQEGYDTEDRKFRGLIRYGGYNHSIGLATHDPMGTFAGPEEVLRPGFVFACDINIPYPDQEMGIRLEDSVVITEKGYENLSQGIPRSVAEIEDLMKKK
ncbi:MAG: aminopeptidase P family protein, partial [Candidatus Aminicenantes bacterium]|nr:aminopeptidase P family protein [Candidatus Aminicenantes bacterium]